MCEKEAFIREKMTKLELKQKNNFKLFNLLVFMFLPKQ